MCGGLRAISACFTDVLVPRRYELPILAGREPGASDLQTTRGAERASELSAAVDPFILRRTNALLSAHLPPKVSVPRMRCGCLLPLNRMAIPTDYPDRVLSAECDAGATAPPDCSVAQR